MKKDLMNKSLFFGDRDLLIEHGLDPDNPIEELCIGEVSVIDNEMPNYGTTKKHNLQILVYTNDDGNIPHFHVKNESKKIDCCIKIESNEYFKHGIHQSELNSSERKVLDKFLREYADDLEKLTRWESIRHYWNLGNRRQVKTKKQPDYTQLH